MNSLHIIIILLIILIFCLLMFYKKASKNFKSLLILDKRQQSYISDLTDRNARSAILQRLFFCIILSICSKTKSYGEKQLKNHFNIPDQIVKDKQKLLEYFTSVSDLNKIQIKIQNCKYTIYK